MKKSIISSLIILSILTSVIFGSRINALDSSNIISNLTSKIENAKSATLNNKIETRLIESNLMSKFAGSYIDEKNILHMKFTDIIGEVSNIMKDYPEVLVEVEAFSMNEMQEIMDLIVQDDRFDSIREIYVDEIENRLIVNYDALQGRNLEYRIQDLVSNLDYSYKDMMNFKVISSEQSPKIETNISGGNSIFSSSGQCSVGFQAYKSGYLGFVTAGHCGVMGTIFTKSGITLGTVTARQWSGRTDASFVDTTSSWTPIKYSSDGTRYKHVAGQNVVVGQDVDVYGSVSTYLHGKIISTNASGTAGGVSFNSYFKYSCPTVAGDSGGLVLAYMEITPNQYQDVAIGIHTVGDGVNGFGPKAYTILTDLGLTATTS